MFSTILAIVPILLSLTLTDANATMVSPRKRTASKIEDNNVNTSKAIQDALSLKRQVDQESTVSGQSPPCPGPDPSACRQFIKKICKGDKTFAKPVKEIVGKLLLFMKSEEYPEKSELGKAMESIYFTRRSSIGAELEKKLQTRISDFLQNAKRYSDNVQNGIRTKRESEKKRQKSLEDAMKRRLVATAEERQIMDDNTPDESFPLLLTRLIPVSDADLIAPLFDIKEGSQGISRGYINSYYDFVDATLSLIPPTQKKLLALRTFIGSATNHIGTLNKISQFCGALSDMDIIAQIPLYDVLGASLDLKTYFPSLEISPEIVSLQGQYGQVEDLKKSCSK